MFEEMLNQKVREWNNRTFTIETTMREIYIEPPILSRNVFNTAYKLGKKRGNKNERFSYERWNY